MGIYCNTFLRNVYGLSTDADEAPLVHQKLARSITSYLRTISCACCTSRITKYVADVTARGGNSWRRRVTSPGHVTGNTLQASAGTAVCKSRGAGIASLSVHGLLRPAYRTRPPLWCSGQASWLQIQGSRVQLPALPDSLWSSGSGTGSTRPL
jgi:hypothetical protein